MGDLRAAVLDSVGEQASFGDVVNKLRRAGESGLDIGRAITALILTDELERTDGGLLIRRGPTAA
ncbi:hypothetical protein [Mycolicibacterium sp.]|uniref:hypothetical protein n=1 Tax=Mycolicibacterium sp. TaxID=2320850 RepID=UPI0037CB76E2